MPNRFFSGINPEYSNLFTLLVDHLKQSKTDQSKTLGNIWKERSGFNNGNLYVYPTGPQELQDTFKVYAVAALSEIPDPTLAAIVASWVLYAHERIAGQIIPTFNKGVILVSSDESRNSFNTLSLIYWVLRHSGFPVPTSDELTQSLTPEIIRQKNNLTAGSIFDFPAHTLGDTRRYLHSIREEIMFLRGPIILVATPEQLEKDPDKGLGAVEIVC